MRTVELTLTVDDDLQEYLIAELSDLDVDAFEPEEGRLKAYLPAARWDDTRREHVERWLHAHGQPAVVKERIIEPQNWNRQWEETIRPIVVGRFLVKPTWADAPPAEPGRVVLEIDPKMSFGTGYHATTRLMLRLLPGLVEGGERVLDAGTGTGILAIAAVKLGAASALAFDIDEWAQENAVENVLLNGVEGAVTFRPGAIDVVPETGFDLILANINLNVLLELLPVFAAKLRPGGRLALSGVLLTDRDGLLAAASHHGFSFTAEAREEEWWAGVVKVEGRGAKFEG